MNLEITDHIQNYNSISYLYKICR